MSGYPERYVGEKAFVFFGGSSGMGLAAATKIGRRRGHVLSRPTHSIPNRSRAVCAPMASLASFADRPVGGAYRVDVSRGSNSGRVSSEWFSRPDDEKYLSLTDLYASVRGRAERAKTQVVESARIHIEARGDHREQLALIVPNAVPPVAPTNWSFDRPTQGAAPVVAEADERY